MIITRALIERFLDGRCTDAEKEAVRKYFSQHPEIVQDLLDETSWTHFEEDRFVSPDSSQRMLQHIRNGIDPRKKRLLPWYGWAAAASLVVICTAVFLATSMHRNTPSGIAAIHEGETAGEANYPIQRRVNATDKLLAFSLADGSRVELSPHSGIRYDASFANGKRRIYLEGGATFRVVKDRARPFSVVAGGLTTTALGTVFKIAAFDSKKPVSVHLLSGKVMVEPDSLLLAKGIKAAFLNPGQEVLFDPVKNEMAVRMADKTDKPNVARSFPNNCTDAVLEFRNEPLDKIFGTLSKKFDRKISFHKSQLSGMSFTGTFDSGKDSLSVFLQTACLLNQLVMRQSGKVIYITDK